MHLGDFIKQYRTLNKLSMGDFAELSGISKAYISVLEKNKDPRNDKPITPSIHIIKKVADVINIPFDELFSQLDDDIIVSFKDTNSSATTEQPILTVYNKLKPNRQEKVLMFADDQLNEQQEEQKKVINLDEVRELYEDYRIKQAELDVHGAASAGTGIDLYDEVIETILYPEPIPKHDIALYVKGDSMAPLFQDGEVIFVRKTKDIHNGQIGVFIINGQGFVKKLMKGVDSVKLISLNSQYKDIILTEYDDIDVVGVVVF